MALGDSITAGFGMHSWRAWDLLDLVEYRGDVFSIGGNPNQYTIPNWLMHYNPNLQGASIGYSLPLDAIKWENHIIQPFDPAVAHLGAGQSGAKVEDVPAQVDYLQQQLLTTYNTTVDYEKDWKMLTIMIGANNLCEACNNKSYATADYYEKYLEIIMEKIYKQLPRTFVNLLPMFNISITYAPAQSSLYCRFMWDYVLTHECTCLQGEATAEDRKIMDERAVEFRQRAYKVAERWQSKNLPDFTVKIQPCIKDLTVPSEIYLSDLDCFHPGALADAGFAIGLWNNFWTPQAQKETNIHVGMTFKCPNENSFFQ